jgi:hypothetical protein
MPPILTDVPCPDTAPDPGGNSSSTDSASYSLPGVNDMDKYECIRPLLKCEERVCQSESAIGTHDQASLILSLSPALAPGQ